MDEFKCLTISSSYEILFEDKHSIAIVTTSKENPEFIKKLGALRTYCYSNDPIAPTSVLYGLDKYDDFYEHLAIINKKDFSIIGAARMGIGQQIMSNNSYKTFFSAKYWTFSSSMIEKAATGMELGRVWILPSYQKGLRGLGLIWKAIAIYSELNSIKHMFGTLSIAESRKTSLSMVIHYLRNFHLINPPIVTPKNQFYLNNNRKLLSEKDKLDWKQALLVLTTHLKQTNYYIPAFALLKHYLILGAKIAGEFNYDSTEKKVSGLILLSKEDVSRNKVAHYKAP